ncbi:hypothetical protein LCGC14_1565170 [marine sediment metagenome]|uniref:Uncharacterized protein n=1 Tax=marine sediment metagenome TaxID=412755 RepID=A0A0F9IL98_9ZZZZ
MQEMNLRKSLQDLRVSSVLRDVFVYAKEVYGVDVKDLGIEIRIWDYKSGTSLVRVPLELPGGPL